MRIKDNIQTSIKYRSCLLFKRLYAAGLAWLSQGLGTKVLAWNKERQEWGKTTICERQEDHGDMGTDINETGNAGTKDETRGTGMNGGVLEMWWKWDRLEDGKGISEEGRVEWICQRSISDQYLTPLMLIPEPWLYDATLCSMLTSINTNTVKGSISWHLYATSVLILN